MACIKDDAGHALIKIQQFGKLTMKVDKKLVSFGLAVLVILAVLFLDGRSAYSQDSNVIHLYTGRNTGKFFEVGEVVAGIVNPRCREASSSLQIKNISTNGTMNNIDRMADGGRPSLALIQEDGLDYIEQRKMKKNVLYMHTLSKELIHIITRIDYGINKLSDLNSDTIVAVLDGSGAAITATAIKDSSGLNFQIISMDTKAAIEKLLLKKDKEELSAVLFTGSPPSQLLKRLHDDQKKLLRFVEIDIPAVAAKYSKFEFSNEKYEIEGEESVKLFGVESFLVAYGFSGRNIRNLRIIDELVSLSKSTKAIRSVYNNGGWTDVNRSPFASFDWKGGARYLGVNLECGVEIGAVERCLSLETPERRKQCCDRSSNGNPISLKSSRAREWCRQHATEK